MPDILVRDVPSEVADALTERAWAAGMDRQGMGTLPFRAACSASHRQSQLHLAVFRTTARRVRIPQAVPRWEDRLSTPPGPQSLRRTCLAFRQEGEAVRRYDPGDRDIAFKILSGALKKSMRFLTALANDDLNIADGNLPLYSAWKAAGRSVELHIYAKGGHGFGMRKQGLPSDHWIERFGEWLQVESISKSR